jgi:sterol desaturase/sphingolipid hydroxylase (fatty acid hydroxylase superfamily)
VPSFLDHQHLLALGMTLARASVWLLLLVFIFVPLERLFALRPRAFFRKSLITDLAYYFIANVVPAMLMATPIALAAWFAQRYIPWQSAVAAWPVWVRVLLGALVAETGFYWGHRLTHQIPLLWRFHSIHHSAEEIYFLISARGHPFDNAFVRLCGIVPVYILGLASPLTPEGGVVSALIILFMVIWGFFIHSNLRVRLGPLEWLIATPAFHHWHHTREDHKDHNFAANLPVMDWLFGTMYLPAKWPAVYGTDTPVASSLTGQLLDPLTGDVPSSAKSSGTL